MKPHALTMIVAFLVGLCLSLVASSFPSVVVAAPLIRFRTLPDDKRQVDDDVFLRMNERLYADSSVFLSSYDVFLRQEPSGRLVLYEGKGGGNDVKEENVVWSNVVVVDSDEDFDESSFFYSHLQRDGHLLTKDKNDGNAVLWKTGKYGNLLFDGNDGSEEYRFALKEDRTAVYVARGGVDRKEGEAIDPSLILWSESTRYNALADDVLLRSTDDDDDGGLAAGEAVEFDDARLVVEDDGNVALYAASNAASSVLLWETGVTIGNDRETQGASLRLEDDGRLIVRKGDNGKNDIVWASSRVAGGGSTVNRWFLVLTRDDVTDDPIGMAVRAGTVDFPGDVVWSSRDDAVTTTTTTTTDATTTTAGSDGGNPSVVTTPRPTKKKRPTGAPATTVTTITDAGNDPATTAAGSTTATPPPSTTVAIDDNDDAERTATCASVGNATAMSTLNVTVAYECEIRIASGEGDDDVDDNVASIVRTLELALLDAVARKYLRCDAVTSRARRLRGDARKLDGGNATTAEGNPTEVSTLPPDEVDGTCDAPDAESQASTERASSSSHCYLVRGGFTATYSADSAAVVDAGDDETMGDYLDFVRGAFDDGTLLRAVPNDTVVIEGIRFRGAPPRKKENEDGGGGAGPSSSAAVREPTKSSQDNSGVDSAGLVGGLLGALIAVGLIALASFLVLRRRKRRRRRWDRSSPRSKFRNHRNDNCDSDSEDTQVEFSPNNDDDDDDMYDDDDAYKGAPSDSWLSSVASSLGGINYAFSLDEIEEVDEAGTTDTDKEERGGSREIRRNASLSSDEHNKSPGNLLPPRSSEDNVALDSTGHGGVVSVHPSDWTVSSVRGTDDNDSEEAMNGLYDESVVRLSARFMPFDSGPCASLDSIDDGLKGCADPFDRNDVDDKDIQRGARVLRKECGSTALDILRDLRERGSVLPSDPARSGAGRSREGGEGDRGGGTSRRQCLPTTSATTTTREKKRVGGTEGVLSLQSRSYRSDETYRSWQVKTRDAGLDGYENEDTAEV